MTVLHCHIFLTFSVLVMMFVLITLGMQTTVTALVMTFVIIKLGMQTTVTVLSPIHTARSTVQCCTVLRSTAPSHAITGSAVALTVLRPIGKVDGKAQILTPCKIYTP